MSEAGVLVTRNVENLRWAMMRNLDDAFRRFEAVLDERLSMTLLATKGAMQTALERHRQVSVRIESEIGDNQQALQTLNEIQKALTVTIESEDQPVDDPRLRQSLRAAPVSGKLSER
jgi:hypothetical protein